MIVLGFGGGFANWTSKVLQDIPLASDEERGKVSTASRRRRASTTWTFLSCHRRPRLAHGAGPLHCLGGLCPVRPSREVADEEDGGGSGQAYQRHRGPPLAVDVKAVVHELEDPWA